MAVDKMFSSAAFDIQPRVAEPASIRGRDKSLHPPDKMLLLGLLHIYFIVWDLNIGFCNAFSDTKSHQFVLVVMYYQIHIKSDLSLIFFHIQYYWK